VRTNSSHGQQTVTRAAAQKGMLQQSECEGVIEEKKRVVARRTHRVSRRSFSLLAVACAPLTSLC